MLINPKGLLSYGQPITPREKLLIHPDVERVITHHNSLLDGKTHYGLSEQGEVLYALFEGNDGTTEPASGRLEALGWWHSSFGR